MLVEDLGLEELNMYELEKQLDKIGTLFTKQGSSEKMLSLESLTEAMGVHYYIPAVNDELDLLTHEHRLEFNKLTPRSIRIMNRFARAANRFLEVNRFKIDPSNQNPIGWVVQTIFKTIISYLTTKASNSSTTSFAANTNR